MMTIDPRYRMSLCLMSDAQLVSELERIETAPELEYNGALYCDLRDAIRMQINLRIHRRRCNASAMEIETSCDTMNHWQAYLEGTLDGSENVVRGQGATELEAINDLLDQLEERQ